MAMSYQQLTFTQAFPCFLQLLINFKAWLDMSFISEPNESIFSDYKLNVVSSIAAYLH